VTLDTEKLDVVTSVGNILGLLEKQKFILLV